MSTDPVPVNPSPAPERQRERASKNQLETLAQLCSLGTPAGTMAAVTGLSEPYIDRLLNKGTSEVFNKLRTEYRDRNLKTVVGSHFELADKVSAALTVFDDTLSAQDQRLRFEGAKWIWEQVVPDLNGKNSNSGMEADSFQLIINQPHVQTQIGETMAGVAKSLIGLREAIANQESDAHVKVGSEALTVSAPQLEVQAENSDLVPTEDPKSDLLTELMEDVSEQ